MTIVEIARYYDLREITPYAPFVYKCLPARRSTAQWWIDIGGTDDTSTETINLVDVNYGISTQYTEQSTLDEVLTTEETFYFDASAQILYLHIPQDIAPDYEDFEAGETTGYTDRFVTYIDDVLYKPLLTSTPSLTKEVDLSEYDQLSFLSGDITFDNTKGDFDDIIDDNIYGNDIFVYYLEDGQDDYTRDDMLPLMSFYVEDYSHSLTEFTITAQDKRKSFDTDILEDEDYPLIYGTLNTIECTTYDDETSDYYVTYKIAPYMTDLGTVYVEGDNGYSIVTPTSVDLDAGTFNVSYLYSRSPGNGLGETDGSSETCKLVGCTGIAIDNALDVIVDLNGLPYTSSNYDIDAWEAAKTQISNIGIAYNEQQTVFEAIAEVQNGCNLGFRYDINAEGKRTILIDDFDKDVAMHIGYYDIQNNLEMEVSTDSELLYGTVTVDYNYDYIEEEYSTYKNDSESDSVLKKYRSSPSLEIETYLTDEDDAIERSEFAVKRYSDIPRYVDLTLIGAKFFTLDLFDIVTVDLSIDRGRTYFGTWKCQVTSFEPDTTSLTSDVTLRLISRVRTSILGDDYGLIGDSLGLIGVIR
jgi:hypothetical protein